MTSQSIVTVARPLFTALSAHLKAGGSSRPADCKCILAVAKFCDDTFYSSKSFTAAGVPFRPDNIK